MSRRACRSSTTAVWGIFVVFIGQTEFLMRNCSEEPKLNQCREIRIRKQKSAWIGYTLGKDEDNIACMAMEWNPFNGLGRAPGGQWQTWRRTVERETKELARSEITSHKSHTMASWDSLCTMPHRGLRTRRRRKYLMGAQIGWISQLWLYKFFGNFEFLYNTRAL